MFKIFFVITVAALCCANFSFGQDAASSNDGYIDIIKMQMEKDPGIQQVQMAAIEYAELHPDKIKKMRRAAENKAWLPKLSLGIDYDADNNVDVDRGGTNDRDVFIIGPEDKSWGWDVSLSWDLSELVWNNDQTSIDLRSKYMVQLRGEILTEVTDLYFERKRMQFDITDGKYSGRALDMAMLRLQELTGMIDGLTGGFLSKEK